MPETTRTHLTPLQLYQHAFCKNCREDCNPAEIRFQNCILCLIADELVRQRQLLQLRTQLQSR